MSEGGTIGWPGRLAVAIVREDPPRFFVAESDRVLNRVLALELVAETSATEIANLRTLDEIRRALLEERWADAFVLWLEVTGSVVDIYPDEPIWTDEYATRDRVALEMKVAPIFLDAGDARRG